MTLKCLYLIWPSSWRFQVSKKFFRLYFKESNVTFADVFQGDFSWIYNAERIELLKVLTVFSLGSLVGLVSLSHLLAYVLKRFKKATYAVIIGFIAGSLGVVWPWKEKKYELDAFDQIQFDANGREIIRGYNRFFPSEFNSSWNSFFFLRLKLTFDPGDAV